MKRCQTNVKMLMSRNDDVGVVSLTYPSSRPCTNSNSIFESPGREDMFRLRHDSHSWRNTVPVPRPCKSLGMARLCVLRDPDAIRSMIDMNSQHHGEIPNRTQCACVRPQLLTRPRYERLCPRLRTSRGLHLANTHGGGQQILAWITCALHEAPH
jgi:hypothetical protein